MSVVRRFLRRRCRTERGAVAVEAALVTPLLVLLVFGIIEMALLMRDDVAVTSAVRAGARIASTGAGDGACVYDATDTPPCPTGSVPILAQMAANAIQRAGSAMPKSEIDYIMVYKANDNGYPGTATSMPASCSGISNCVEFTWRDNLQAFRYASGTWTSSTINGCFPGTAANPLDRVGVDMHATHPFLTGLFGTHIGLEDHAVFDFEPLPTATCASGQHQ